LADELDVGLDRVTPEAAPPSDTIYGSPMGGGQGTGGSTSIRAFYTALRQVGASARAMLVQAAAAQWRVDPASLRTENGEVIDDANKRKLGYGALAAAAARLPAPQTPRLKADKDFKLIGKSVKRLDTPDKVNGRAEGGRQSGRRGPGGSAQGAWRAASGGSGRSGGGGGRSFLGGEAGAGRAFAPLERRTQWPPRLGADHGRAGGGGTEGRRRRE